MCSVIHFVYLYTHFSRDSVEEEEAEYEEDALQPEEEQ
jgi:hypothetical protein